jgi:hypothetical protein
MNIHYKCLKRSAQENIWPYQQNKILYNKKFHDLYRSPGIDRIVNSRRLFTWMGRHEKHVEFGVGMSWTTKKEMEG